MNLNELARELGHALLGGAILIVASAGPAGALIALISKSRP